MKELFVKKQLSPWLMAVYVLAAAGINFLGSWLSSILIFPLYLDSVTTIAVTAYLGLIPGIACAVITHIPVALVTHTPFPFVLCHLCTAVFAWLVFKKKDELNEALTMEDFLWAGLWSALSNAFLGNILMDLVFSSGTDKNTANLATQAIYQVVKNLTVSTWLSGIMANFTDKILSCLISWRIYVITLKLFHKK